MLFKYCSDIDALSDMQWGVNVTAQRLVKGDSDCVTCCCINLCSPRAACALTQNLFPVSPLFCFLLLLFVCKLTFHIKSVAAAPRPLMRHPAKHPTINSSYLPKWYFLRYFCFRPPIPTHGPTRAYVGNEKNKKRQRSNHHAKEEYSSRKLKNSKEGHPWLPWKSTLLEKKNGGSFVFQMWLILSPLKTVTRIRVLKIKELRKCVSVKSLLQKKSGVTEVGIWKLF